jgi:hypothetical protein
MPPYVVTPFHHAYPHHYYTNNSSSFTTQHQLALQLAVSPSLPTTSPALYLSAGEEDHCVTGPDASGATSSSYLLAQHDPLSFTDYLAACHAARPQLPFGPGLAHGPSTPHHDHHDHDDLPQRGQDLSWTAEGCSRTLEPLTLSSSWTSPGAWTDAIY